MLLKIFNIKIDKYGVIVPAYIVLTNVGDK